MDKNLKIEAAKGIMASLFASQRALKALAPEYKWTGLGNLLGDFGEFIAAEHYGLTKAASGSDGFDARTEDGRTVQVKANHSATTIGFRGSADLLLVLKIDVTGDWEEVYFGPFEPVKAASRYSARDNKQMIAMTTLRQINTKKALEAAAGVAAAAPASASDVA